jgi:hypothetical protein
MLGFLVCGLCRNLAVHATHAAICAASLFPYSSKPSCLRGELKLCFAEASPA